MTLDPFARRRCVALTAVPLVGLGVTAIVEWLGVPRTSLVRAVLYLGFAAVLVGGGAAFLAWGRHLQSRGRHRLGTALERGVGVVFAAWVGWSLLNELTRALPHSLAVLETLVLATAILFDGVLALLFTRFDVRQTGRESGSAVTGLLLGGLIVTFALLWELLGRGWPTMGLLALVGGGALFGGGLVRLERARRSSTAPPSE